MSGSVSLWIREITNGDDQGTTRLWRRYWPRILRNVRRSCKGRDFPGHGTDDIAQSVFVRVVRRISSGDECRISNRRDFWRFVERALFCKLVDLKRRATAKPFDYHCARPLPTTLRDPAPAAEHALDVADRIEQVRAHVSPDVATMCVMRWRGYTCQEIASTFNLSPRTIQRKLSLIEGFWEGLSAEEGNQRQPE